MKRDSLLVWVHSRIKFLLNNWEFAQVTKFRAIFRKIKNLIISQTRHQFSWKYSRGQLHKLRRIATFTLSYHKVTFYFILDVLYYFWVLWHEYHNFILRKHSFLSKEAKKLEKKIVKKLLKFFFLNVRIKFASKKCCYYNKVVRKMILIFFVLVLLPKIKLWIWGK